MNITPQNPPQRSFLTTVDAAQRIWNMTMYEAERGSRPGNVVIIYAPEQNMARVWIGGERQEAG